MPTAPCSHPNPPSARFCTTCGVPLEGGRSCTTCGVALAAGARFCTQCGTSASDDAVAPRPSEVVNGVWHKEPGEIVRRVTLAEMRGKFDALLNDSGKGGFWDALFAAGAEVLQRLAGVSVQVPTGCIAVVVVDGVVREILPPGHQTVSGSFRSILQAAASPEGGTLWDRAKDAFARGGAAMVEGLLRNDLQRSFFFLVDRRPVLVPFHHSVATDDDAVRANLGITVTASVAGGSDQAAKDALTLFIDTMVRDRESLHVDAVRGLLLPHVERVGRDASNRYGHQGDIDLDSMEAHIREGLSADFGNAHGLRFDVIVAPRGTTFALNLRLGQSLLPDLRPCVLDGCSADVPKGQRFCTQCGTEQPAAVDGPRTCGDCEKQVPVGQLECPFCGTEYHPKDPREMILATQDAEAVELDIVLRAQGDSDLSETSRVVDAVAAAAARHLRGVPWSVLSTPEGFRGLEQTLLTVAQDALRALGFRLLDLTVLDCKSRAGEWMLAARTDLRRARAELEVSQDWLNVDGDRIDLQAASLELVLRRKRLQGQHEHAALAAELAQARLVARERLGHRTEMQDVLQAETDLDVTEARRGAARSEQLDEIERTTRRILEERAADDEARREVRAHELDTARQQRAQELERQRQENERATNAAAQAARQAQEASELGHQISLEARSAEHDATLVRGAVQLEADKATIQAKTTDTVERLVAQRAQDIRKADDEQTHANRDRDTVREQSVLDRSVERELSAEERRKKLEMDEFAAVQRAQMERLKAEQEAERELAKVEADRERARLEAQKGMTAAEILASATASRALTDAEAAALADAAGSNGQQALAAMERLLGEKEAAARAQAELQRAHQAQLNAMFQAMLAQQQDSQAEALRTLAATTESLAGGQRAQAAATQGAYKDAAAQAVSMSERSMDTMARVAAAASSGPQQIIQANDGRVPLPAPRPPVAQPEPEATFPCKSCGTVCRVGDKVCGHCGQRHA